MVPHDHFTPHGYLDNPYHSWKLNPSGVLRSLAPLGMGWHVPNLGSYVRNQFQYTAHLQIGLKIGKTILITPADFKHHGCTIVSHLHTKNRFEYTCNIPKHALTLTARYFLIDEHVSGCILTLATTAKQPLPVTCYVMHQHVHNPHTSRLWEHGLYAIPGPEEGTCMLGIASEGDVFMHGVHSADGGTLDIGEMGYVVALEDAAIWARGVAMARPNITEREESTGWQVRTLIMPCTLTLSSDSERVLHAALARGVSQDQSAQRWAEGMGKMEQAEAKHRADDETFWRSAPQLSGDWPESWRRGFVYDLETLRMVMRPSAGVVNSTFDGMQIQAPRLVLAEAAMDILFLSYADPELASEVILTHFESAPHPNLPCMREDGSYNMVADDGQLCGTAPEWGFPVWCCHQLFLKTGDMQWLRRLYPGVAAYLRWWLDHRRDAEGWEIYACSWESGQDVSSRFGPQQTGGTIIQHVRPVDLQASMAQSAEIVARWAELLAQALPSAEIDFSAEALCWKKIADEFTVKTRLMWQDGWFRDYDSRTKEWSTQQDTMHLAPIFCGVAGWGHIEQLRSYFAQPPGHSGWASLSWPPVVMTVVGAAATAGMATDAAELAYRFIDASYRSTDSREPDEHGGLPGVTREYRQTVTVGKWGEIDYVNAGIEGYGWGALSIHLLIRHLFGLHASDPSSITLAPTLPAALRRPGATYTIAPIPWGKHLLSLTCQVKDAQSYEATFHVRPRIQEGQPAEKTEAQSEMVDEQEHHWEGAWGDERTFPLSQ
ncbi:MAG TPA: trehalase family glycosidase [Ktedonobacteraceae bacterium]|nr:trehalase family glycosidase [Ktedonobacteraceae bacterium]